MPLTQWERSYERKQKTKKRIYVILFIIGIVAGSISYLILFSGEFNVRSIHISGTEALAQSSVIQTIDSFFDLRSQRFISRFISPKNIMMVGADDIEDYLQEQYALLAAVSVQKKIPHELIVVIEERDPIFIACNTELPQECFYVDKDGIMYDAAPQTEGSLIAFIETQNPVSLGGIVFDAQKIQELKSFQDMLYQKLRLAVKKVVIGKLATEFELFAGWSIKIDITTDFGTRFNDLVLLLNSEIRNTKSLEYIDLTIPNRAYYK